MFAQYLSIRSFSASQLDSALSVLIHRRLRRKSLVHGRLLERLQRQGWIARDGERWVLTVPAEQIDPGIRKLYSRCWRSSWTC